MRRRGFIVIAILVSILMIISALSPVISADTLSPEADAEYYIESGVTADTVSNGQLISEMMHILHQKDKSELKLGKGYVVNEKIIARNTSARTLELELTGTAALAPDCSVYQLYNNEVTSISFKEVYVGAKNVFTFFNAAGLVQLIVVDGPNAITDIRAVITPALSTVLDHNSIIITSKDGFRLLDKKAEVSIDIPSDTDVTFTAAASNAVTVTMNGQSIYTTSSRLYAIPVNEASLLQIKSFKRAYGYPNYRGFFEIAASSSAPGKLRLINELPMEQYLYQVVPSEMPASFGFEALKAQTVAARTYAINECITNSSLAKEGVMVYDSVMSQVYNNSAENALTNQAVDETRGLILVKDGQYVDCRYYSTSGGYGASIHEVWADGATGAFPGTPLPYLTARSYTYDPVNPAQMYAIDTSNEDAVNAFYKDLSFLSYDSESLYFRWMVSLTKQELENTINKNIILRYAADPRSILTQNGSGEFVSTPIPSAGVGTINNMYVSKRGAGGNMMELVIEGSTGTYKLLKEYNIRFTIRPNKTDTKSAADILAYRTKGGSTDYTSILKNPSILYSAFCTFDIARAEDNSILTVTFYGGGNGHGVGMSQYGASMLGLQKGFTFDQILTEYYAEVDMINMYDIQDKTNIFKGIFKHLDETLESEPFVEELTY